MIRFLTPGLKKKAAVVAVIFENPFETSMRAAEMGADLLELRLDLLGTKTPEKAVEIIRQIKSKTDLPVIITNRSSKEGGKWVGREAERTGLINDLLSLQDAPDAIDIELSTDRDKRDIIVKAAKKCGVTVIISAHDFSKTPAAREMKSTLEEAFLAGADIAKLAVMPHSMRDILDLLEVTLDASDAGRTVCTIAMEELGKHTRVIAPFYGSVLTYASVESTVTAAPGQLPVAELKKLMELLE